MRTPAFFGGAYEVAGPTLQRFHDSTAATRGLMGPFGGGKTQAAIQECKIRSAMQDPSPRDGIRRARGAIFRDSYASHAGGTMVDWFEIGLPKEGPGINFRSGGTNSPSFHDAVFKLPDSSLLHLSVSFWAVQEHNVEAILKSKQWTWAWADEATEMPQQWFFNIGGRVGRFPKAYHGGPTWAGFWMTYNAPEEDHYLYDLHMNAPYDFDKLKKLYGRTIDEDGLREMVSQGIEFFEQPSGLSPNAENIHNLPGGRAYYYKQVMGKPEWWVSRMIHNRFGMSRLGEPVFTSYSDERHLAPSQFGYNPDLPLYVGLDAGRTPAAVFVQQDPSGAIVVVGEFCFVGTARPFARALKDYMIREFRTVEGQAWIYDPTAEQSRSDTDDDTWAEIFADEFGLEPHEIEPAETNKIDVRLQAINDLLDHPRLPDGLEKFMLNREKCPMLRRGFNSGYHWTVQPQTGYVNREVPNKKHPSSHPMDALQYVVMYVAGLKTLLYRQQMKEKRREADRLMAGAVPVPDGTGL